jgi:hypothetical protein
MARSFFIDIDNLMTIVLRFGLTSTVWSSQHCLLLNVEPNLFPKKLSASPRFLPQFVNTTDESSIP